MNFKTLLFAIFLLPLTGCNTVGPYYIRIYKVDEGVFSAHLSTWTGTNYRNPTELEKLKHDAEVAVREALKQRGYPVRSCAFITFTPFEGGHIKVAFFAGDDVAVNRWVALPPSEVVPETQRKGGAELLFETTGRFPESR